MTTPTAGSSRASAKHQDISMTADSHVSNTGSRGRLQSPAQLQWQVWGQVLKLQQCCAGGVPAGTRGRRCHAPVRGLNALRLSGRLIVICDDGCVVGKGLCLTAGASRCFAWHARRPLLLLLQRPHASTLAGAAAVRCSVLECRAHLGDALAHGFVVLDVLQLLARHARDLAPHRRRARRLAVHARVRGGLTGR